MNHLKVQKVCAYFGYLAILLFGMAFWPTSNFIPVPSPMLTPMEVAHMYQANTNGIRFGMVLMSFSGALIAPYVAVISVQLKRIEKVSPILTYTQLSAGSIGALFILIPAELFSITAYRPYRAPELTYLLNDISWFFAVMPVTAAIVQNLAIACAIFMDRRASPVFPRWLGYLNVWIAVLFIPGTLLTFFKTGPFAWNGLLSFYVAGTAFVLWFLAMTIMLLKAIDQQAAETESS